MKTNKFFLLVVISFLICFGSVKSQEEYDHKPIPKEEIPARIKQISDGTLKESIFWAAIGFFLNEDLKFSTVTENTFYVNETGVFFRLDIADAEGNPVAASVSFFPHNRAEYALNEHLCLCQVKVGYSQIIKRGTNFICVGIDEANKDDNIDLQIFDIEVIPKFLKNYYEIGFAFAPDLTTIPITVKELQP